MARRAVARRRAAKSSSPSKRGARGAQPAAAPPPSPYRLGEDEVERLLATGEQRSVLEDYFGPELMRDLESLAKESMRRARRGGPRVLILPGIMGSKLGVERKLLPDDVIWVDLFDTLIGRLRRLALPDGGRIRALGVLLLGYLKLKLTLRIAGFDAGFFPFDWRQSLAELGRRLADAVAKEKGRVHLVAHSMGGLVARAALEELGSAGDRVASVVMLGTPNFGSFSPLLALRGEHDLANKLAAIDLASSSEQLARRVFATLPGLVEMLPSPERWSGFDLYDAASWPSDRPRPPQAILTAARATQAIALAPADARFRLIAGVNKRTIVDFRVADGRGQCFESFEGDGTVPLDFALLPGAETYYIEEQHGSLPNNSRVAAAVIDLLRSGTTDRLPKEWLRGGPRSELRPCAAERRAPPFEGRRGLALTSLDRRRVIDEFVSAAEDRSAPVAGAEPAGAAPLPSGDLVHSLRNVEVTRRRAHALEICLARGSITEVQTRALALGVFRGVDPAGAAASVDEHVGGAIKGAVARRMFSGELGALFVMPTGRHRLYADHIVLAGLGAFDAFEADAQQFVAENLVRAIVQANVEEFASVLFGTGSGWSIESALACQLRGYVRGLLDGDPEHRLRRITLCEMDGERFAELKRALYGLASTSLFDELVLTFDEIVLPEAPTVAPAAGPRLVKEAELAYLIVSREENPRPLGRRAAAAEERAVYRASILTRGAKATVVSGAREVRAGDLDALLARIERPGFGDANLRGFGEELASLVLDPSVARIARELRGNHLVVVHDAVSSRIPWETLCIDGWFPAAEAGLSRRYAAENLSAAKWLEARKDDGVLDLLLIANPTGDLEGADHEADRIRSFFPSGSAIRLKELRGAAATRSALLAELSSGKYDVVHYAGHAFFDAEQRARSGIVCHGGEVLSGAQLAELRSLPALAFFNACEAGRVRSQAEARRARTKLSERIRENVGLAEAFLRGGVATYVGTYWPVGDAAAESFATTFYAALVKGTPLGAAVQAGRQEVRKAKSVDWADYVHYGAYDFVLKRG